MAIQSSINVADSENDQSSNWHHHVMGICHHGTRSQWLEDSWKKCHKPTVWRWFIHPIHGDFLGWLIVGFCMVLLGLPHYSSMGKLTAFVCYEPTSSGINFAKARAITLTLLRYHLSPTDHEPASFPRRTLVVYIAWEPAETVECNWH